MDKLKKRRHFIPQRSNVNSVVTKKKCSGRNRWIINIMTAGWVNNPQAALPTPNNSAAPLQLVRTEVASWMRAETETSPVGYNKALRITTSSGTSAWLVLGGT